MLHLRVLGTVDLTRDGESLAGVLAQPKRVALLAYLAVAARGGYLRRDVLISLFWPEQDAEHGRASLRQLLHGLRGGCGDPVLRNRGQEEVGLDPAHLSCDVWAFRDAVEAHAPEEAIREYRGPFVRGFFLGDAPDFERWAEEQRDRAEAWHHPYLRGRPADPSGDPSLQAWLRRLRGPGAWPASTAAADPWGSE